MFDSIEAKHIDRKDTPSRFMLLVSNTNGSSEITQFNINNQNKPTNPTTVSASNVIKSLRESNQEIAKERFAIADERILINDEEHLIWHYRPVKQKLFYKHEHRNINQEFPFPSLLFVFKKKQQMLYVAAMRFHKRPTRDSALYHAPLPNVSLNGGICLGNVVINQNDSIDKISKDYLDSFKTHLNSSDMFRKGKTNDSRYYRWAKEAIKKGKISMADLTQLGTVSDFITKTTNRKLEG